MAAAQIASSATAMISLLIDSFVIGRLIGSQALSAYGLASPMLIVYAAIGNTSTRRRTATPASRSSASA